MSITPDALLHRWFEELWNQGKEETIDALMAPGTKIHGLPTPDGGPISGPEAFKPFFRTFRGALPDLHVAIERTVTQGDMVVAHCHVTGTHGGPHLGVAPTGKSVDFWGMTMARARDGKLVEGWNCFDFLSLYQQIGLLPGLAGA
jgi:predicted ester cyclase